ncbi:MAG: HNH endonuclease [Nitrospirae bacterium]|nr:HNH endonuclease [Nitrospirota bacterium]
MLNSAVLVLNRSYMAIDITTAKKAFVLLYKGIAAAVDDDLRTFDFDSWRDVAESDLANGLGTVSGVIAIPKVILLQTYSKIPRREVRFNRFNLYMRDENSCQYCGEKLPKSELTLDHIVPRSKGGRTTWENVVCCCIPCNLRKGGRTPQGAHMRLMRKPIKPAWWPTSKFNANHFLRKEWLPFLSMVDAAYWNTKLQED